MNNQPFNYLRKGETTIDKDIVVGTEIDAYCTKCRLMLNHVVVAMVGTRPKKVECLTCHSQHAYKASEPGSRAKANTSKGTAASKGQAPEKKRSKSKRASEKEKELWKVTLATKDLALAKPYTMADSYEIDDVIDHRKFGIGIVMNLITPQKMEVLFEDGRKCMVCNFLQ